jgi:hypothetical protein
VLPAALSIGIALTSDDAIGCVRIAKKALAISERELQQPYDFSDSRRLGIVGLLHDVHPRHLPTLALSYEDG